MTTDEYLRQIEKFDIMIRNKKPEIERLRNLAVSRTIKQNGTDIVQSSCGGDRMGNIVVSIVQLEHELDELCGKRQTVMEQISQIASVNAVYYDALIQRYVQNKQVKSISINNVKSVRHIQRILSKAKKAFEKMFGNTYL